MINAIMTWIPSWWYIGLMVVPVLFAILMAVETNDNDAVSQFFLGLVLGTVIWVMGSIALTMFYYMVSFVWYITLGMFFPSIWDVPLIVWIVLAIFALIAGAATPAYEYIILILRIPK